jgi:hypothetical protein
MLIQNDHGTVLRFNTGRDLAGASQISVTAWGPKGTKVTLSGPVSVSGQEILQTVGIGDITKPGDWIFQAHLTLGGWSGSTVPVHDKVLIDLRQA